MIKAQESYVLQGSIQNTESSGYEQKFTGIQVHKPSVSQIEKRDREQAAEDAWPHDTKLPRGWREAQVRRTQMLPFQLPMEGKNKASPVLNEISANTSPSSEPELPLMHIMG